MFSLSLMDNNGKILYNLLKFMLAYNFKIIHFSYNSAVYRVGQSRSFVIRNQNAEFWVLDSNS
jgi:hypothetical protein